MEDTSFNVTFIILQQPLEKRQPWGCVEHTALMTTTGETQRTLENGHQMFKEKLGFFFLPVPIPYTLPSVTYKAYKMQNQLLKIHIYTMKWKFKKAFIVS